MAIVTIGIADMNTVRNPDLITTLGLGSCVGITLYDPKRQIGGMVHIMLPLSNNDPGPNKAKYADTGIVVLLNRMLSLGANRSLLVAKIAGGSHMFGNNNSRNILKVGERNVEATRMTLNQLKLPIIASDTGGHHGRTIELDTATGNLQIRTVGFGTKYI